MRPEELHLALGFDNLGLLPTDKTSISSRKSLSTKTRISKNVWLDYPIIASPMDTVSGVKTCVALNSIGAAGVLHRFMGIEQEAIFAKHIKSETGKCYAAVGLQDYKERVPALESYCDVLYLDTANGSSVLVEEFMAWYVGNSFRPDIIIGNTLTKASVSRAINLGASGVRHGIGLGSACTTSPMTGIQCPPVTALYYGWKAIRNHDLEQTDLNLRDYRRPSLLLDGGIKKPSDMVKAIVCGADAVICGGIFAGCAETPGLVQNGKKKFRGMASKDVLDEYGIYDGNEKNLFIEGMEFDVPYTGKSVKTVVYEFTNGLRSAMSYMGFDSLEEMRGSLWEDRCVGIRLALS